MLHAIKLPSKFKDKIVCNQIIKKLSLLSLVKNIKLFTFEHYLELV